MKPKSFLKRVIDFAVSELERRSAKQYGAEPASSWQPAQPEAASSVQRSDTPTEAAASERHELSAPEQSTRAPRSELEVVRGDRGGLRVRWALDRDSVQRSSSLIDSGAVLCLRLVSFSPARDHVVRDVQDRPSVAVSGECDIGRIEGRAVVALGLRHGGRFVSITHHVL